jgi:hypothetical protein
VIFITAMDLPDSHPPSNEWRTHSSLPKLRQSYAVCESDLPS